MKIISYNVNGIRAAIGKGFIEWLTDENPDIIHIQETKAQIEQVDLSPIESLGYTTHWHSAEKKGYSGVASFVKPNIEKSITGIGIEKYDSEGRFLRLDMNGISMINSYFPSGTTGTIRQDVKEAYLEDVLLYVKDLHSQGRKIIISGDFNICHKAIDINNPKNKKGVSGFLPNEREWMDRLVAEGFIDTFREFDTEAERYSWWSYRAGSRARNVGWRIDYHFISESLRPSLKSANILTDIVHSDHCPVTVELDI